MGWSQFVEVSRLVCIAASRHTVIVRVLSLCHGMRISQEATHTNATALTEQKTVTQAFVNQRSAFFCGPVLLTYTKHVQIHYKGMQHLAHRCYQCMSQTLRTAHRSMIVISTFVLTTRFFISCQWRGESDCWFDMFEELLFSELKLSTERLSSWMEAYASPMPWIWHACAVYSLPLVKVTNIFLRSKL